MILSNQLVRSNIRTLYQNTVYDKEIIYAYLNERINEAISTDSSVIGTKNLIYFSVFGSDEYVSIFERLLKSIYAVCNQSLFDLMVITDANTKAKIEALEVVSKFAAFDYFLVKTPGGGVDASIQKLQIFKYPKIDRYAKILFLDCDILATFPLEEIFWQNIDSTKIEVASTWDKPLASLKTPSVFHVLDYFSPENIKYLEETPEKCHPFNAGQFLFSNSLRMKKHFENVLWLMEVWPGEYYFEQSFMNHYFLLNGFTSSRILNTKVAFINVASRDLVQQPKQIKPKNYNRIGINIFHNTHTTAQFNLSGFRQMIASINISDYYLLHFVGNSANGQIKLKYIDQFMIDKNICQ